MKQPLYFTHKQGNYVATITATSPVAIQVEREKNAPLTIEYSFVEDATEYCKLADYGSSAGPKTIACTLNSDAYDITTVYWRIVSGIEPTAAIQITK